MGVFSPDANSILVDSCGTIEERKLRPYLMVGGLTALLTAGLVYWGWTSSFAWDEGFHLLAAQLINRGKHPYLDFFHPQAPLYAYWNAFWMALFGQSWRVSHVVSALLTGGAIFLTGDYVMTRVRVAPNWRIYCALLAVLLTAVSPVIVDFGTIGQAYGICLFLVVAAFRISVIAVDRETPLLMAIAGFCTSAAASCSLLTAPFVPVLLLWVLWHNRAGSRIAKFAAFVIGGIVPCVPWLWLLVQSPRIVLFDSFGYHMFYRTVEWSGAGVHNLEVMTSWSNCSPALLLPLLALVGLVYVRRLGDFDRRERSEYALCCWIVVFETAHLLWARPTFPRYFLLIVPFLSILAVLGFYAIGTRIGSADRPFWSAIALALVILAAGGRHQYDERSAFNWNDFMKIAQKVNEVTPPGAVIWADEHVFFLTKRTPPMGEEYADSHKLNFPPDRSNALHVEPRDRLIADIKAGRFVTSETCEDDDKIDEQQLDKIYSQKATFGDCNVFWGLVSAKKQGTQAPAPGAANPTAPSSNTGDTERKTHR